MRPLLIATFLTLLFASSGCARAEPATAVRDAGLGDTAPTDAAVDASAHDTTYIDVSSTNSSTDASPLLDTSSYFDAAVSPQACDSVIKSLQTPTATTTATLLQDDGALRSYRLQTTAKPLDGQTERVVTEQAGWPRLRTCNLVLDALYAMALQEVRQLSVDALQDGAFNGGKPVSCKCFQTGAKWPWAWTRDVAYAIDLSLGLLAPLRSRDTLLFKLSKPKKGVAGQLQVVQDTGTGGAWPVSTDRVAWALGALRVRNALTGPARAAFEATAKGAIEATLQRNFAVAWDPVTKRYGGETSFLDWREQSYPHWMKDRPADIAMSHAQSTNALHELARTALVALGGAKHPSWAPSHLSSTFSTTFLDRAAVSRRDLLGEALLARATGDAAHLASVRSYPRGPHGPPALFPQQPLAAIYHNRAVWPFVSAYGAVEDDSGADALSIIEAAARNLSNMENYELLSGAPWVDDGAKSGPVVNSKRQLWSVAAFLAVVHHGWFGARQESEALTLVPHIGPRIRPLLKSANVISLLGLPAWGQEIDAHLSLPAVAPPPSEALVAAQTGAPTPVLQRPTSDKTADAHSWQIALSGAPISASAAPMLAANAGHKTWFSPRAPTITKVSAQDGKLKVQWHANGAQDVTFNVHRDGSTVAQGLTATSWVDPSSADHATKTHCYAVEARWQGGANTSQHSAPVCAWGDGGWRVTEVGSHRLGGAPVGPKGAKWQATWSTAHGKPHWQGWGAWVGASVPETAEIAALVPPASGEHLLQLLYANTSGPINTGITCATKRVRVLDAVTDAVVGTGFVVMPQLGTTHRWGESSILRVGKLVGGHPYRVLIDEDGGVMNMSYLQHFSAYTAGPGGGPAPHNRVDLAGARLLTMDGKRLPAAQPPLFLDGQNDLDKMNKTLWLEPAAKSADWDKFAAQANETHLVAAFVSKAFEDQSAAAFIYLAPDNKLADGVGVTMSYYGQTANLGFKPRWVIALRRVPDFGDGFGPWPGLYRSDGAGGWILQRRFQSGVDSFIAKDQHTLSLSLPWAELAPLHSGAVLRVVAHVFVGATATFYDRLPAAHSPSKQAQGGYFVTKIGAMSSQKWQQK